MYTAPADGPLSRTASTNAYMIGSRFLAANSGGRCPIYELGTTGGSEESIGTLDWAKAAYK